MSAPSLAIQKRPRYLNEVQCIASELMRAARTTPTKKTRVSPKTKERRDELRAALLVEAERTIAAHGLGALKARDLALAVGCATGAIYNVYPDLDSLILEVNAKTLAAVQAFLSGSSKIANGKRLSKRDAVDELVDLGLHYLEFATTNLHRWRALFEHRMQAGHAVPSWYVERQLPLFGLVEKALRTLQPALTEQESTLLSRSLFSAVHGVVSLGLEERLGTLPAATLRSQLAELIRAFALGLAQRRN